jgi:tetratricopeptide (TPR) repeat protein
MFKKLNVLIIFLLGMYPVQEVFSQSETRKTEIQAKIDVTRLSQEGYSFLRSRRWKDVDRVADQIYQKNPSSPESYYLKGGSLHGKGEYYKSIESLNKALQLQSNHDPSLFFMGMNYFRLGIWNKAMDYFSQAAESGSFHPFYRYNLALTCFVAGDFDRAILESQKTLQLKENYFKAKVILAKALYRSNKKQEALDLTKEMYEKKQESEKIISLYAELLMDVDKNYRKAIQIIGTKSNLSIEDRRVAGFSYMQLGEWNKAIIHYKNFVRFERDTEEDALNLIRCLLWAGRDPEAEIYLSRLIASNKDKRSEYSDIYQEALDKRNLSRDLYTPFF